MKHRPSLPGGLLVVLLAALTSTSCSSLSPRNAAVETPASKMSHAVASTHRGLCSWYSIRTNYGRTTASGIPLSDHALTAAHRSLPFGTLVRVTNLENGRSQTVKITDRGPFIKGRIIDVSMRTAHDLDMVNAGVVPVTVEVLASEEEA